MKLSKYLKLSSLLLVILFTINSCADLSVNNVNDAGREDALSSASNLVSLLQGSTTDVFFANLDLWGVHMNGLADQMTATNAYLSFWDFAEEPRLRLNNRTTYADAVILNDPFTQYNAGVSTANTIIKKIEVDGESVTLEDGTDITQKMLAGAYFLRGISRGSLGMIYDKGYIVAADADVSQVPEPKSYTEVIDAAVSDIDKAIQTADAVGSGFVWDFLPSGTSASLSLAEFKTVANSFAARFLANAPRTQSEASSWDWDRVLTYADKGMGGPNAAAAMTDYSPTSIANQFFNNMADWSTYVLSDGSGYIPTDIKIIHTLDPSYPVEYPAAPDVLEESDAQTNDPRIGYYNYTPNFGFLNASRNRSLFSNYWNLRLFSENAMYANSGYPTTFFIEAEVDYIRAEANFWKGDKATAAQILNDSPYGTGQTDVTPNMPSVQLGYMSQDGMSGGNSISASATDNEFIAALHREYSVELDLIDQMGLQWFFMRRHDMLQEGTPLHYAIPGEELEITQREYYTFGGVDYAGEPGTASGSNSWKKSSAPKVLNKAANTTRQGEYNGRSLTPAELNIQNTSGGKRAKKKR